MREHTCEAMRLSEKGPYGAAVEVIFFNDDRHCWEAMAGMNEYFSTIKYCPFCGAEL